MPVNAFFSLRPGRLAAGLSVFTLLACGGRSENQSDTPSASSSGGGEHSGGSPSEGTGGSGSDPGGVGGGVAHTPGSVEEACDLFGERYGDCTAASDCPFEEGLTPCQAYCLTARSCASLDAEQSSPDMKYGYGECFLACDEGFFCPGDRVIIESFRVCDGVDNCDDGLDEEDDSCGAGTGYICGDVTIARRQVCDGTEQCDDGSDEAVCPAFVCLDGQQIIPENQLCDHESTDCNDGSDEAACLVP